MKEKSPLFIQEILFTTITNDEKNYFKESLDYLSYESCHDFSIDKDLYAMVARIEFGNRRYLNEENKGLRREVSFNLIDCTDRQLIASRRQLISINSDQSNKIVFLEFSVSEAKFLHGHTYKLTIKDENAQEIIHEQSFNLYSKESWGHPVKWYSKNSAGIRFASCARQLFRSVKTASGEELNVRFYVKPNFTLSPNLIMPELEIELFYPKSERKEKKYMEPICYNRDENLFYVELPFISENLYSGTFYAEINCMGFPIAGFVFCTDLENIPGEWIGRELEIIGMLCDSTLAERHKQILFYLSKQQKVEIKEKEEEKDNSLDVFEKELNNFVNGIKENDIDKENFGKEEKENKISFLESLKQLTGLKNVKEKLNIYERVVRFNKLREGMGFLISSTPLHAMFLGSPGTGKTTVAKLLGSMLHDVGMLSKGHVVVRERATLLGPNYSSEEEKTLAAIEEAQGGILFIDEAYQLYQKDDPRDPGKFVIETLLTSLADTSKRDWMLILAGYPDEMRNMFKMNPGFKSRIPDSNIYLFEDFSENELMEIAENYFMRHQFILSEEAREALTVRLKEDHDNRNKNFGNARHVVNLIESEILPSMAVRVTELNHIDNKSLTTVEAVDIPLSKKSMETRRRRIGFLEMSA